MRVTLRCQSDPAIGTRIGRRVRPCPESQEFYRRNPKFSESGSAHSFHRKSRNSREIEGWKDAKLIEQAPGFPVNIPKTPFSAWEGEIDRSVTCHLPPASGKLAAKSCGTEQNKIEL